MARKKIPLRPQPPQVKPSTDGQGQAAPAQPQAAQQPAQPQTVRPQAQQPVQAQPGQAQAAQTAKPKVQPIQQSQPIQK